MYSKTGQQFPYVQVPITSCIMFPDDVLKEKRKKAHDSETLSQNVCNLSLTKCIVCNLSVFIYYSRALAKDI